MSTFRHHPDGVIYIDEKAIPIALFAEQEPAYVLPVGFIGREYVQGKYHRLFTKDSQIDAKQFPWESGDIYISKKAAYKTEKPKPEPEPKTRDEEIKEIVVAAGVTQEKMIEAIFRNVAYSDPTKIEEIKVIIAEAEAQKPEK